MCIYSYTALQLQNIYIVDNIMFYYIGCMSVYFFFLNIIISPNNYYPKNSIRALFLTNLCHF